MKTIIYSCNGNGCKKTTERLSGWLEIAAKEGGLCIENKIPGRSLITISHTESIHFCSKECFVNKFFHREELINQSK